MKVSRLGIKMYDETDPLPAGAGCGHAVNQLREEVNKIAVILDGLDERFTATENIVQDIPNGELRSDIPC